MTAMKVFDIVSLVAGLALIVIAFDLTVEAGFGIGLLCHWARPWTSERG